MKHGFTKYGRERFYRIRCGIIGRCYRKSNDNYKRYGGRGIKCEWRNFIDFRDDMYGSYLEHVEKFGEKETTIDRINVNGNYYKRNCRWATNKEQQQNRENVLIKREKIKKVESNKQKQLDMENSLLYKKIKKRFKSKNNSFILTMVAKINNII